MKKETLIRIVICLLFLVMIVWLVACGAPVEAEEEQSHNPQSTFHVVEKGYYYRVVYNEKTKVMYTVSMSSSNFGNFTLLVNPDGTPMLWEG